MPSHCSVALVLGALVAWGGCAPRPATRMPAVDNTVAPQPVESPRTRPAVGTQPEPSSAPTEDPETGVGEEEAPERVEASDSPGATDAPARTQELFPFHEPLPSLEMPSDSLALKYANLSPAACRQEVRKRKLPVKRDRRPTPGVATALRFTGPVHGVRFATAGWKSPFGVMDCRLVLAFEAMAEVLYEHGVAQVNMGTMYRRGSKLRSRKLSQHAHGLAADILGFKLEDGRELVIERDFAGEIGQPACGPESRLSVSTEEAITLRNIVCDLARRRLFHYMLTPNYDRAHHDHLHVDIIRNGKRGVIR